MLLGRSIPRGHLCLDMPTGCVLRKRAISRSHASATLTPMKGIAVNPAAKTVGIVEREVPRLNAASDVLVRMLEVGVCGTDKEICRFEFGTPPGGSDYLVLGHESLGEVTDAGADASGIRKGDLVVGIVRRPCTVPGCLSCRAGRQDFCYTGQYVERGIKEVHGFMTGMIVEDYRFLCVVPQELRDIAVLTEPLTIAEKGLRQIEHIQHRLPWVSPANCGREFGKGLCAVVLGAGPVGLLGAMALLVRGFKTFVYSREAADDSRARLVESMGAHYVSSVDFNPEQLAGKTGNIDLVYEATGFAPVSFDVLRFLGSNGVYIFTGIPGPRPPEPMDMDDIMRAMVLKNQVVLGTVNADRQSFVDAIADLGEFRKRFPEAVKGLITKRYQIEEHADLLLGRAPGIKNVLSMEKAI